MHFDSQLFHPRLRAKWNETNAVHIETKVRQEKQYVLLHHISLGERTRNGGVNMLVSDELINNNKLCRWNEVNRWRFHRCSGFKIDSIPVLSEFSITMKIPFIVFTVHDDIEQTIESHATIYSLPPSHFYCYNIIMYGVFRLLERWITLLLSPKCRTHFWW